jgi:hypothetical protein
MSVKFPVVLSYGDRVYPCATMLLITINVHHTPTSPVKPQVQVIHEDAYTVCSASLPLSVYSFPQFGHLIVIEVMFHCFICSSPISSYSIRRSELRLPVLP